MELFPHVLIRIGGGPFENLEALNLDRCTGRLEQIYELQRQLDDLGTSICDGIYPHISAQQERKTQNLLLNFRRDIYNQRAFSPEKQAKISSLLNESLKALFTRYTATYHELQEMIGSGEEIYARELVEARAKLYELSQDVNLRKGLLLSSQSLLDRIDRYLQHPSVQLNKKEMQTELSLVKYLTRMLAKTSPFSTFTNLAMGRLTANGKAPAGSPFIAVKAEDPQVISHVRLNNYLFEYVRTLLLKNPEIYRSFRLRPNPTTQVEEEHFLFLTNHNNIESFQRIPYNEVIELFQELVNRDTGGMTYEELIQTIIREELIEAEPEELEAYIDQLIEYGFLEFNLGVSGIDPDWDLKLRERLEPLASKNELLHRLVEALQQIREQAMAYGKASLSERKKILEEAYTGFRSICMELHEAAGLPAEERKTPEEQLEEYRQQRKEKKDPADDEQEADKGSPDNKAKDKETIFKHRSNTFFHYKPEQIFYEDTTLAVEGEVNRDKLSALIGTLQGMMDEIPHLEGYTGEKDAMVHYFLKKFKSSATVDVLRYYEDFYKEYKKPEAEYKQQMKEKSAGGDGQAKKEDKEDVPENGQKAVDKPHKTGELPEALKVPRNEKREVARQKWLNGFLSVIKDQVGGQELSVNFALPDILKTHAEIPVKEPHEIRHTSFGLFIQLFEEKQSDGSYQLKGVLNSVSPGYGKWISRFLHIFDDAITNDVRTWNQQLCREDEIFAEDCDASMFNANLHPPLMANEIWMPGGHNTLDPDQQIPITALAIKYDPDADQLFLVHRPSGKKLYVFDLGFQALKGRSQLFRLLSMFTRIKYVYSNHLIYVVNRAWDQKAGANGQQPDRDAGEEAKPDVKEEKIYFSPRITYEDKFVFQRKSWNIPKSCIPVKEASENDWSYLVKIDRWRKDLDIPDEVFIYITNPMEVENLPGEKMKRVTRDDYKPQYVCFHNPFTMLLFEKAVTKVPVALRIEEMYPDSKHLLPVGKHRHVSEYLVQWYV